MPPKDSDPVDSEPRKRSRTLWIAISLLILFADYFTDPYVSFPVLFLLPVYFLAYDYGTAWGASVALLMLTVRYFVELPYFPPLQEGFNSFLHAIVFVLFSELAARNSRYDQKLREDIRILRGLLPVCSYCKKIRDEGDEWRQIEEYISKHSEAQFSHTYCPECLREHFPHFADRLLDPAKGRG